MVSMRAFHRPHLMILGFGAALTCLSGFSIAAAAAEESDLPEPAVDLVQAVSDSESAPLDDQATPNLEAQPAGQGDQSAPTSAPDSSVQSQPSPTADTAPGLEPGEQPLPLNTEEINRLSGGSQPNSGVLPFESQPVDQTQSAPPPDYLNPDPNPLLTPTRPEEVQIVGTQPLSLENAVDLAYKNNEDLQIAQLQLEQSQAALREQQALLYPTVDLQATLQTGNSVSLQDIVVGGDTIQTFVNGTAQVNYDLGLSGERRARIRAAEESVRSAELDVEQRREQLRLDTITDYYALQESIEQIRINETFLTEAERNLRDTSLREDVGVGTRFDVLRAQVQVANARQTLTQATSQKQINQRKLASRLNVPPSINLTTTPVAIAGTWPLTLEESIVQAFQNRAELEQLLVQRDIGEQQREISLASVRPSVNLFANYNLQQFLSGTATGLDDGFNVGAQLQWRLYDGGAARAGADQQDIGSDISEVQYSQTRNQIRVQVEQSYYSLKSNQDNIDTASLAVKQATEALDLANLRFNAGVGTQLDVLSATSDLTQAQGNLVSAILDYNRALASLERAVSNVLDTSAAGTLDSSGMSGSPSP